MLVEDNPGDQRVIRELLNEAGRQAYQLDWVDRLSVALERLRKPEHDLVLLDLSLPESRGIETFEAVQRAAPAVPVVVLTGSQDDALGREAVRRGAQDFIDKNEVTGPMLARAIPYAIERGRLLARQRQVEDELRSKTRQLEAISDTLGTFLEKGEWQAAVSLLVRRARELTGSPMALVGAVEDRRVLKVFAAEGSTPDLTGECVELSGDEALMKLVESGRPICVALDPAAASGLPSGFPSVESILAVPLLRGGEVAGLLAVAGRPGGYTPADLEPLAMLARAGDVLYECHTRMQQEEALEDRLRQSQKMEAVGTLAAGVAHHFNNLLMIMMGNAELVLAKTPHDAPARRNVESIQQTGKRASELIQQLIAFRKAPVERPDVLDLNDVTSETLRLMRCVVPDTVRIRFEPYGLTSPVVADPAQIEQVLMNLVANARDALPRGGEIIVETSHVNVDHTHSGTHLPPRPGRYAMVAVSDNGCGMEPPVVARIFEPFFTTKEQGQGTGLGLFAVWGIVQQFGGHVSVDSEPGRGSTFRVFLPRCESATVSTTPSFAAAAPEMPAPQGHETIMVVEDDREVRHLVSTLLRRSGYNVLEAAHGGEALNLAERRQVPIDLLVTDAVMPTMSGHELARRLESVAGRMKVLYIAPGDTAAISQPGVRGMTIERPFDEFTLAARVRELLDGPLMLSTC